MAAGKGSRLGDLTTNLPKSLLKLNCGRTLLDYNISILEKLGVSEILIVTGFQSQMIEKHVENKNIKIVYNPFWNHCNVLGSLYRSLPYLVGHDFLFLHADTLVEFDVWNKLFKHSGKIVLPYKKKECGEEEMKIKISSNGNFLEINKTMQPFDAIGEFLGIAKFSSLVINDLIYYSEQLFKKGELNTYMEEVVQLVFNDGQFIDLFDIGESLFVEVDFLDDYNLAKDLFSYPPK